MAAYGIARGADGGEIDAAVPALQQEPVLFEGGDLLGRKTNE
jgi:hypothetical protein